MTTVAELTDNKRVLICAGSGGVGKTTTSAAIAAGMAARGLRVAVLTIDPAKRLADSLGLAELGNVERQVDPALFTDAGVDPGDGELWAMMLDSKATFDEVVMKHAPDEETRDAVLSNRIYRELSSALAGSQEYMAMEKLYEIWSEDRYDLLVLDTPPSRNALDFLEAPNRLLQFIEGRSLQVFLAPTGFAAKVAGRGTSAMFSVLRRITGVDLLQDLSEFFSSFSSMVGGFKERAAKVNELLGDEHSSFLIICGPQSETVSEAVFFRGKLREQSLPFGGAIVNKVHRAGKAVAKGLDAELAEALGPDLAARVASNYADYRLLAERDRRNIERLRSELETDGIIEVPYLDHDVHDLAGLFKVNEYLFGGADVG
ncbi:MAG TPA: ArsA-related P-loop ATPase [Solirubrobacterales bacterium]|nr:ArsA-related P-loop ATPase [Solirubrobacterales bacterium]